ncbi:MAG: hypothetical protein IH614_20425 [Desulfuromonadales bacterium]|nr:hypothetical protein [Desulfuromonadales bacterium]
MRVIFALEEIYGKNPREVAKLFRRHGINPGRPYRARVSSNGITVEQE